MKARKRERMKKRRARFVVGYIGRGNVVFGRNPSSSFGADARKPVTIRGDETNASTASPLTRHHAEKLLDEMPCGDCAIFELVPIKVNR